MIFSQATLQGDWPKGDSDLTSSLAPHITGISGDSPVCFCAHQRSLNAFVIDRMRLLTLKRRQMSGSDGPVGLAGARLERCVPPQPQSAASETKEPHALLV